MTAPAPAASLRDRIAAALETARVEWMRPGSDAGQAPLTDHLTNAVLPLVAEGRANAYRAGLLAAADVADCDDGTITSQELWRMARADTEEQQPPPPTQTPACEGFVWIGQPFTTCERCGQPAWEHAGEEVPADDAGPFDMRRTVRPWNPGQADRIRARWDAAYRENRADAEDGAR
jgi:hypothetical protein